MNLPINKIDNLEYIEKKTKDYFSFHTYLKEKYGLSSDLMRMLDLISLEELLALKMENMARIFNGKIFFPIKDILWLTINKSALRLIEAYAHDSKAKQKITGILLLNKRKRNGYHNWVKKTFMRDDKGYFVKK